jgi:hypothetical protein
MEKEELLSFDDFDMNIQTEVDPRSERNSELSLNTSTRNLVPVIDFFKEVIKKLNRNQDRVKAIVENIDNSKILELSSDPKLHHGQLLGFQRFLQNDLAHELADLEDLYKEITLKPKSLENYTIQYTSEKNRLLSGITSDREKMEHIFSWEMDKKVEDVIQVIKKLATSLFTFFTDISDKKSLGSLSPKQELLFEDSKSLCLIIFDELEEIRKQIDDRILKS